MNFLRYFWLMAALMAFCGWPLGSAAAQGISPEVSSQMQERLRITMTREPSLTEEDIRIYLTHAEAIYRLRYESAKLGEVVLEINPWTEARFAYVTTKMAVGMLMLMKPDDSRIRNLPEFSRPTRSELELIRRHQDELTRTMESLQAKYSSGS